MASMYGKSNPGRHYCRDCCCFMDIYIYAGSVFVYTGKFDFTNCCGGGSNPFAGYCRGW